MYINVTFLLVYLLLNHTLCCYRFILHGPLYTLKHFKISRRLNICGQLDRLPVHFSKQLVDSLSGVRVHGGLNPFSTNAVKLIDEDHTGSVGFSLPCEKSRGDNIIKSTRIFSYLQLFRKEKVLF